MFWQVHGVNQFFEVFFYDFSGGMTPYLSSLFAYLPVPCKRKRPIAYPLVGRLSIAFSNFVEKGYFMACYGEISMFALTNKDIWGLLRVSYP